MQRDEQLGHLRLHALPPRERRRHAVHSLGHDPELLGLRLVEPLVVMPAGDPLECADHVGERLLEAAPVVPQPHGQRHEDHAEDDRRRRRRLDGVVACLVGDVLELLDPSPERARPVALLHFLEVAGEVHHRRLRVASAAPGGVPVGETGDGDGEERRDEQPADARRVARRRDRRGRQRVERVRDHAV